MSAWGVDAWEGAETIIEPMDCPVCGKDACEDPAHFPPGSNGPKPTEGTEPGTGLKFTTGAEFEHETVPDMDWLAPPYFPRGSLILVDGKPKVAGKTSFLLALSRAVVTGGKFLGETAVQGPVVYLSEQGKTLLRPYMEATGLIGHADFHFVTWGETFGLSWFEVARETTAYAERVGAVLVVVDTVGRWLGLADDSPNKEGPVREALGPLKALSESTKATVLLSRHEGKADRPLGEAGLGSTAYQGEVDAMASLRKGKDAKTDNARELHFLGRWEAPDRQVVERDHADHGLYRLAKGGASLDVRILQLVRCTPGASKSAVCKGVSGRRKEVLDAVDRMLSIEPPLLIDRGTGSASKLHAASMGRAVP